MTLAPKFPTSLHHDSAESIRDYFIQIPNVDTILIVNSCARGQAVPESDLDFAILVKPETTAQEIIDLEVSWLSYSETHPTILKYKKSNQFAQVHLDIINGIYTSTVLEMGGSSDFFEVQIGNQICYSAPMGKTGDYFEELRSQWLPYYDENLRLQRFIMTKKVCEYNLDHIPFLIKRELYFHAFDSLWKAFQEYLQVLFIANKTYPIAYNKWIKEQLVKLLNMPELYSKLSHILSIGKIESDEINGKAKILRELLDTLTCK